MKKAVSSRLFTSLVCTGLLFILLTPVAGCNESKPAQVLTFQQLFSNPEQYHGKEITLEGFYFHGFEVTVIAESLKLSGYVAGHLVPGGRMLWVEGGIRFAVYDELYVQTMMGPEEHYGKVRITGKFEYGATCGHLGGYSSLITLSEIEVLAWSPPEVPVSPDKAIAAARAALSASLDVPADDIRLINAEHVMWSNTSLGCPEPGKMYADVIVPGFRIIFEYAGKLYLYHTDIDGTAVVTCQGGAAE